MASIQKLKPVVIEFLKRADMLLFSLCFISSLYGLVIISSAVNSYNDGLRLIIVQSVAMLIGIALFILLTIIDIDIIADRWPVLLVFSVLFLATLLIWGYEGGGRTHWLRIPGIGVSIQPTEVVKFVFVVLLAKQISYLIAYKDLNSVFSIGQIVLHFGFMLACVLLMADDLGAALVFLFAFIVMIFVAGVRLYWFAAGIAVTAAALPFIWDNFFREYQRMRILAPYVASIDPDGTGYNWQLKNSKIALASGQLTGTGLYNGIQSQSSSLPEKQTDLIFAVAGEELGMIGCCVIILLLIMIIVRCAYVGMKSKNTMNMLICFGIAAIVFFQTFENIGMCIGLTPVIGQTLPFFSYGGSSLFTMYAAMGIVSGIKYRPKPERFRRSV